MHVHALVDCHAHLADAAFDADRAQVLARARAAGVGEVVVVAEDALDAERVLALAGGGAEAGVALRPCVGLHPDRFAEERALPGRAALDAVSALARSHAAALAAIGEVGLDRWLVQSAERRAAQLAAFEELIALARALDLPLNVHSRSAGHHAIDALAAGGATRVLLHAFDGRASHARRGAERGWLFSIPPSVVRSEQKQKLVRALPLEALALESDAPVLGPSRDERNEPANLVHARDFIAAAHGVSPERVAEVTTASARRLFG